MNCCYCDTPIPPLEPRTSINDAHYHARCFDRQAAKDEKNRRADAADRQDRKNPPRRS
jgi:hypothetical protein